MLFRLLGAQSKFPLWIGYLDSRLPKPLDDRVVQVASHREAVLNIGDDASTFNEMREKIDRRVAAAEAKLQLGSSSVDAQMQDIEREAMDIQLQDKLLEYKQKMGLLGEGSQTPSKQIAAGNDESNDGGSEDVIETEANEVTGSH